MMPLGLNCRSSRVAGAVLLALLLSACSGSRPAEPAAPQAALVWPAPPEPARVAFVQSVYRPRDLGARAPGLVRFGRWITGSEKGNERLIKPFGIALDEKDNLCLTDTGANAVCFYERVTKKWSRWTQVGALRFAAPVAVAKSGEVIYVADSALGKLIAFDTSGQLRFATNDGLGRPSGVAVLAEGLYVADAQRHCLVVFDFRGNRLREIGRRGSGPGEFNFPTHTAAGPRGEVLVTDSLNNRVQVLDSQGRFQVGIGQIGDGPGQFSRPKGAAMDRFGHLYAIDAMFDNLQIFNLDGRLLLPLGASGSKAGEFWLPNGIAISRDNEIYVTDSYNHRIQIFKYLGSS